MMMRRSVFVEVKLFLLFASIFLVHLASFGESLPDPAAKERYDTDAAPSQLIASAVSNNSIRLQWSDNSTNETSFVLERSQSRAENFVVLNTVAGNVSTYTDENLLPGIYYYRIHATVAGHATANSNVAGEALGTSPLVMSNSTVTTCDQIFLDPGGLASYDRDVNITMVVNPSEPGKKVSVRFFDLDLRPLNDHTPGDWIEIFDGGDVNAAKIASYTGTTLPSQINATNSSGALTFRFKSDWSGAKPGGWQAKLSCVAMPSDLVAVTSGAQVELAWQDIPPTETGYRVERKAIGNTSFAEIASLPANSASYVDQDLSMDNLYEYRVRAVEGQSSLAHSNKVTAITGSEPFLMREGNHSICHSFFLDPGGNGPYYAPDFYDSGHKVITTTLSPSSPGTKVSVKFSEFELGTDQLTIYDGSADDPLKLIGSFTGNSLPPRLTATNPAGTLTFVFENFEDVVEPSGWKAQISCVTLPAAPGNLLVNSIGDTQIQLTWTDNAMDETGYQVERATGNRFVTIATLAPNAQTFTDATIQTERKYTYRVRAVRESAFSSYSNTVAVTIGNEPLLMRNGSASTCNTLFMDTGGDENFGVGETFTLTLNPDVAGSKVKVDFSSFDLGSGYLHIYDGANGEAPPAGSYTGSAIPPEILATNLEGSITFIFISSQATAPAAGWEARISCISPPAIPGNLLSQKNNSQIDLMWEDNSDDETGFIIERATGNKYVVVTTLSPDAESYTDTDFPDNRAISYRVRSKRDGVSSDPSNTSSVVVGVPAIVMHTGAISTCHGVFLDPAGNENYGREYMVMTISPGEPGKMISIAMNAFDVRKYDVLRVHNGDEISDGLIWTSQTNELPQTLQATNHEGKLTFMFSTAFNTQGGSGWDATTSCVNKGHPLISFPDRTVKYVHPDDGSIFLEAGTYDNMPFTYSVVDDPSNTAEVELIHNGIGIFVKVKKVGTVKIKAALEENDYAFAAEKIMTLTIEKGIRTINFYFNSQMSFGSPPKELKATVGNFKGRPDDFIFETLPPTSFYSGEIVLSGDGGRMMTLTKAGYSQVKAKLAETDLYLAGEKIIQFEIKKGVPVISFPDIASSVGTLPVSLEANAYPGADFIFSISGANSTGSASLSGPGNKTLTSIQIGTVTLKAFLPETQNYFSAERTANLTITGATPQSIAFPPLPAKTYGDLSFGLTAIASSSLSLIYESDNALVASVFGGVVHIHGAGTATITAMQPGNETFAPATPVEQTLVINKKGLVVSLQNTNRVYGDPNPPFVVSYQGFVSGDTEGDLDVIPSGAFTPATEVSEAGDYTISFASQGLDNDYEISYETGILTILRKQQQISFDSIEDVFNAVTSLTLQASASSGLPVDYRIVSGPAFVSGNVVSLSDKPGIVEVEAAQAGNVNYLPAPPLVQSFSVRPDVPTGIEDPVAGSIDVWPNPSSSNVVVKSKKNHIIKVSLFDLPGKAIHYDVDYEKECTLEIKSMTKGVYVMSITLDSGVTIFRRLVIN